MDSVNTYLFILRDILSFSYVLSVLGSRGYGYELDKVSFYGVDIVVEEK